MENPEIGATKRMGMGKKIALATGVLFASALVYCAWAFWYYDVNAPSRDTREFSRMWHWALYVHGMNRADRADTYGGETPEETLALYLAALEAGDIELAAKYYVPEKQVEVLSELTLGKQNGVLPKLVNVYSTATSGKATLENKYFMSVSEPPYSFDFVFVLNTQTSKWKISEP